MKNQFIKVTFIFLFRIALSIYCLRLIYHSDTLTSVLLSIVLLAQPIISLLSLKQMYKVNKEYKFAILSAISKYISYALYVTFAIVFLVSIYNNNTLGITISILILLYAYNFNERSLIMYDKNTVIYNKTPLEIKKIASIEIENSDVNISYFNGSKKIIKLRTNQEAKILEKILKRTI